jgi:GTP-binding protein EngB required for normal cell division
MDELIKQKEFYMKLNHNLKLKIVETMFDLYQKQKNQTIEIFFSNLVNNSSIFVYLFEKINPNRLITNKQDKLVESTKELKKQMIKQKDSSASKTTTITSAATSVNMNRLRLLIELIQLKLNNGHSSSIDD